MRSWKEEMSSGASTTVADDGEKIASSSSAKMASENLKVNLIDNTLAEQADEELRKLVAAVFLFISSASPLPTGRASVILQSNEAVDRGNLAHLIFSRLLMQREDMEKALTSGKKDALSSEIGSECESSHTSYLSECYLRLQIMRKRKAVSSEDLFRFCEDLILQNLSTAIQTGKNSGMYPTQEDSEILWLFYKKYYELYHQELVQLFTSLFTSQDIHTDDVVSIVCNPMFTACNQELQKIGKNNGPTFEPYNILISNQVEAITSFLQILCSLKAPAECFMRFNKISDSELKSPKLPHIVEHKLLGRLLTTSPVPLVHPMRTMKFYFYENARSALQNENVSTEKYIWSQTDAILNSVFACVNSLIRVSATAREMFLVWVGQVLVANKHRGRPFDPETERLPIESCHGVMQNILYILLKLCDPFLNHGDAKLLRINWLYPKCKANHISTLHDEATLVNADEEQQVAPVPDKVAASFLTSLFFLTQYCIKVGFMSTWNVFTNLVRKMHQAQDHYNALRSAVAPAEEQNAVINLIQKLTSMFMCLRSLLNNPSRLTLMLRFAAASASWCTQIALLAHDSFPEAPLSDFKAPQFPLSNKVNVALSYVPELCIEVIEDVLTAASRFMEDRSNPVPMQIADESLHDILSACVMFMGSPERMKNPHLRAKMAMVMHVLMPEQEGDEDRNSWLSSQRSVLFTEHALASEFIPSLLHVFCSIEMTGSGVSFEEKFGYRKPMYALLRYMMSIAVHQNKIDQMAIDAYDKVYDMVPPVFLRFCDHLCNDSTFLLDESLRYMSELKKMEIAKREEWGNLPNEEQVRRQTQFDHYAALARFHNVLGANTLEAIKLLAQQDSCKRFFSHSVNCDRLAQMLNYFVVHLVDPVKRRMYKVQNLDDYEFKPRALLEDLAKCYYYLGAKDTDDSKRFLFSVMKDQRSFSPKLFDEMAEVMSGFSAASLVENLRTINNKIRNLLKASEEGENDLDALAEDEDCDERFKDAIMGSIMLDPVRLPASGMIVDRAVIARHLLSSQYDPFNRQPLTMSDVEPLEDLKNEITAWLCMKKAKRLQKLEEN